MIVTKNSTTERPRSSVRAGMVKYGWWLLKVLLVWTFCWFLFLIIFEGRMWEDSTFWAMDYNEQRFQDLNIGADREAVLEALGAPLAIRGTDTDGQIWYYTTNTWESWAYYWRTVAFDQQGRTVKKVAKKYYD